MSQEQNRRIAQQLLAEMGQGADTDQIAKLFSADVEFSIAGDEGAGADGGWQYRAARGGNAAGWGDLTLVGELIPALRVRRVDGADVRAHPVRSVCRRHYLSLQQRRGGTSTLGRDCRPLHGLQAGAASAEDKDRLLQGCKSAGRLSRHPLRLSRLPVSSQEDNVVEER